MRWTPKDIWDAMVSGPRGENNPPEGVIMIGNTDLTVPPDRDIIIEP